MSQQDEILNGLKMSVVNFDVEQAVKMAKKAVEHGVDAKAAISQGLSAGMTIVGSKYESHEYYLPQVLTASTAMTAALEVLKPHIKVDSKAASARKVVICTVEGDVHSIGKTIVGTLLTSAGYNVHDLGADVQIASIVDTAQKDKAELVGMSTLMTTTMAGMEDAINMMRMRGIRDQFKVAVGGAPVNDEFAKQIGADITAVNAETAVKAINKLFGGA